MYVRVFVRTYVPDSRLVKDMALDFQIGSVVSAICLVRYELYPTTTYGTRTKCGIKWGTRTKCGIRIWKMKEHEVIDKRKVENKRSNRRETEEAEV